MRGIGKSQVSHLGQVRDLEIQSHEMLGSLWHQHNGMLHRQLSALLGMVIGEPWKLDELAEDCAAEGGYEFMLTAKPLNVIGGVGSPPNALAIK